MRTLIGILFLLLSVGIFAQNNIGIGTTTPNASAMLDITATDKGILIPRVTLNDASTAAPITSPAEGLLIYNYNGSESHGFWYWDGSQWVQVGSGGGSAGGTLDDAYNFGGNGAGRVINADYGAVEINLTTTTGGTEALNVNSSTGTTGTPSSSIYSENSAYGGGIYSVTNNTANPYNSIEGSSNSNNQYTSGVAGYYDGTGQGVGVYGSVYNSSSQGISGVLGVNNRTNGGWGVEGQGYNGVVGQTNYGDGFGVWGSNTNALSTGNGVGVIGDGFYGVWGQTGGTVSNGTAGVFGINARTDGGWGVEGQGFNGTIGTTIEGQGYGIYGENASTGVTYNNIGVAGLGWVGVWGETNDFSTGYGVYANGDFGCSGTKSFMIDYPLDPENKYLKHFCIESPEILNMYRGVITLNSTGEATVQLPAYFDNINTNFSYQLTPIGASAPGLYIKEEISNGQFVIAGGQPNMKVSWTVYAERNDPYLQKYPEKRNTIVEKRNGIKGKYLIPQLYNQPENKKIVQPLDNKTQNNQSIKPEIQSGAKQVRMLKK